MYFLISLVWGVVQWLLFHIFPGGYFLPQDIRVVSRVIFKILLTFLKKKQTYTQYDDRILPFWFNYSALVFENFMKG
jgi:hypothetical protein